MPQNDKLVKVLQAPSRKEYYIQHMKILNAILPVQLTSMEMNVLAEFMSEPEEYRFSAFVRKKVGTRLNLSRAGMSNYLKQLASKGFLQRTAAINGSFRINPVILPTDTTQSYQFTLNEG